MVDLEGNPQILPLGPRNFNDPGPGWSPDGVSVAFASDFQIYTYNTVLNTTPRQITFERQNRDHIYSPDGTRLVFASQGEGTARYDLFVKDLNSDAPPRSLLTLDENQRPTQWFSDTLIVFEHAPGGNGDLWLLDLSNPDAPEARPYLESEANLRRMVVSPDGRLAAYRSNESGTDEIYVRSFPNPGERTLVSEGGGLVPFWSPDGSTLYYQGGGGRPWVAARLQREPVPAVLSRDVLFTRPPAFILDPFPGSALHPDGDRFIFASSDAGASSGNSEGAAVPTRRVVLVQNFFEELRRLAGN